MCTKSRKKGEVGQKRSGWRFLKKVCGVYDYIVIVIDGRERHEQLILPMLVICEEKDKKDIYIYACMYICIYGKINVSEKVHCAMHAKTCCKRAFF